MQHAALSFDPEDEEEEEEEAEEEEAEEKAETEVARKKKRLGIQSYLDKQVNYSMMYYSFNVLY